MSLDKGRISIVSSTKVDGDKLSSVGDTADSLIPESRRQQMRSEKCCPLCCVMYGSIISTFAVFFIASSATAVSIFAESRVNYTINGVMRQIGWIAFPGTLVGASLHYFLAEAMWSGKHNSWGQAWTKATIVNAGLWSAVVGLGTLGWRKGLPQTAAGRRLYHRYPIPSEPLETRLLRSSHEFFTGMGATYWLSGVASGHLGFVTCVTFCVATDRPYMMMAPHGGYARRCMPPWRRQQLEQIALGASASAAKEAALQQPAKQKVIR
ncbi:putative mitochondrial hypothetical protein [Leptomonas pyrrhocoris]|uniref:Uncharacterized protein n=1 Tax=Leptomonas pyrrhocoris TaxID=157538 RepID=A0A0M9GAJ3_LEPPY|nr:putative mitochondrial hypothetical protein [Leptomonas pyrrhocoris]XP_015664687.1 putative mitochondrial hypothetical protein [Leptomonas pyrrhocoris]KPA86247.1 putative mitochondrial hypothetical protein [Leptomonas pyrrhocoris]KPA86248.1 putative mitochondrial hypothetical protein [Leptomonas pyrrhocoris]|eukprot:XP_015664686.1 putative mitochondrial hypothetical protein [Leptomonas pyrrhocoris]